MDFTLSAYEELCEAIVASGYKVLRIKDYLELKRRGSLPKRFVILRHDVDARPANSLKVAKVERKVGISSTFYFRVKTFDPRIARAIESMGHEVGYHYECLDEAKGNLNLAIKIFEGHLNFFRKFCEVSTVCMHGNPLTPWRNSEMWERYRLEDFGLLGEAYLSIDYSTIAYYTDTGRSWCGVRVKDLVRNAIEVKRVCKTSQLVSLVERKVYPRICLVTHPQRWEDNLLLWLKELTLQSLKNVAKNFLKRRGEEF